MQATQLHDLTLTEAAAAVRDGTVSPRELTRALLERIARLDPLLNCFITVMAEQAEEEAHAAEQARAAGRAGPLNGVPLAVKDLFDTAGVRTTAGSRILSARTPDRDATVVARLRAAGAVLLGKLNMHEFAFGVTTNNPHYGPCRNPWDRDRIPGGSSGGSGAAVAAGLCLGALGSDTGGSIRIPAALCGITGLKPTYGRVSRAGVLPLAWTLDHVGPMTRTVADAALLFATIAGHDPSDPASADAPAADVMADLELGIRGLRVGVPRAYFFESLEPAVAAALDGVAAVLRAEGAQVVEVSIEHLELAGPAFAPVISAEAAAYHQQWLRERPQDYGADVLARLLQGAAQSAVQYVNAQRARRLVVEGFLQVLDRVDVLLTPTVPVVAAPFPGPAAATPNPLTRCTFPFNLAGLPTLSVPCGFDHAGLPIGAQFAGRPFDEATVLRAGRAYERVTEWAACRPPLPA